MCLNSFILNNGIKRMIFSFEIRHFSFVEMYGFLLPQQTSDASFFYSTCVVQNLLIGGTGKRWVCRLVAGEKLHLGISIIKGDGSTLNSLNGVLIFLV